MAGGSGQQQRCGARPAQAQAGFEDEDINALVTKTNRLVLHAVNNLEHKDQLPLFVPASVIIILARKAGVFPPASLKPASRMRKV